MPTPANVLSFVRNQIAESAADFYTDSEIYGYMSQAELEVVKRLKCNIVYDASNVSGIGTREYSKPTGYISAYRITYDSLKLKKIDFNQFDMAEGTGYGFTGSTGSPEYYADYGDENYIALSPIPNVAGKTIAIWYLKEPDAITDASGDLTIPSDFGYYLADYCLFRMYFKDDQVDKANAHIDLWNENLKKMEKEYKQRKGGDSYRTVKDVNAYPSTDMGII